MKPTAQGTEAGISRDFPDQKAPPPRSRGSSSPAPPPSGVTRLLFLFIFWIQKPKQSSYRMLAESAVRAQRSRGPSGLPRGSSWPEQGRPCPGSGQGLVPRSWGVGGRLPSPTASRAPDLSPSPVEGPLSPPQEAPLAGQFDSSASESAMLLLRESPSWRSGTQSQGSLPLLPSAHEQVTVNGKRVDDRVSPLPATGSRWRGRAHPGPSVGSGTVRPQPPHPPGPTKGCFAGWQEAPTSTGLCDLRQPPPPASRFPAQPGVSQNLLTKAQGRGWGWAAREPTFPGQGTAGSNDLEDLGGLSLQQPPISSL